MNANAAIHTLSEFSALYILSLSLFSILPLGLLLPCVLLFDIRYFYASIALTCATHRLFVCSFFGLYFAHRTAVRSWQHWSCCMTFVCACVCLCEKADESRQAVCQSKWFSCVCVCVEATVCERNSSLFLIFARSPSSAVYVATSIQSSSVLCCQCR